MRLIDADELKKEITKKTYNFAQIQIRVDRVQEIIDNAPTERPSLNVKDLTEEDIKNFAVIYQRATSKGLIITTERPQGEWIIVNDVYCECPFCKNREVKFSKHCPECGARLKGGAE